MRRWFNESEASDSVDQVLHPSEAAGAQGPVKKTSAMQPVVADLTGHRGEAGGTVAKAL